MNTNFEFRRIDPLQGQIDFANITMENREDLDMQKGREKRIELEDQLLTFGGKVIELLVNSNSIPSRYETIARIQVPQERAKEVKTFFDA